MTLRLISQVVILAATALSYALGMDTYFTHPTALNVHGAAARGPGAWCVRVQGTDREHDLERHHRRPGLGAGGPPSGEVAGTADRRPARRAARRRRRLPDPLRHPGRPHAARDGARRAVPRAPSAVRSSPGSTWRWRCSAIAISQFQGADAAAGTLRACRCSCSSSRGVTLGFWLLRLLRRSPWTLRALYVWTGLVGTLAGLQFWLVLGELYTVTQAKRLYKLVGAGSVLGAVAGAGVARVIAEAYPPEHLVLAAAIALVLTGDRPRPAWWGGRRRAARARWRRAASGLASRRCAGLDAAARATRTCGAWPASCSSPRSR